MKKFLFSIGLLALMLCLSSTAFADSKKKKQAKDAGTTITLVTSGTGSTKEEATKNALRSALEQTYGAFVSANSTVVNDELVKDEIVSISSGNIVEYEELSFQDTDPKQVAVKSVVSITNLVSYAQNKGMAAELAGNTFAMNMKMEELNKKNEAVALNNMIEQLEKIADNLFDYEIIVGEPEKSDNRSYYKREEYIQVPVHIYIKANANTLAFYETLHNTLTSLAIEKTTGEHGDIMDTNFDRYRKSAIWYKLRGGWDISDDVERSIIPLIERAILNCEIIDNMGNVSGFYKNNSEYDKRCVLGCRFRGSWLATNRLYLEYSEGSGRAWGVRPVCKETLYDVITYWLGTLKPSIGEKLYNMSLFLRYSLDEIAKVSKIEIRPKVVEKTVQTQDKIKNPNDVLEVYKYACEQHKLDPKMEKGLAYPYFVNVIRLLETKSGRTENENLMLKTSFDYAMRTLVLKGNISFAKEIAEAILAIDPSYGPAIEIKNLKEE